MPRPHGRPIVQLTEAQRATLDRLRAVLGTVGEWLAVDEATGRQLLALALVEARQAESGGAVEFRARPFQVNRRPDPPGVICDCKPGGADGCHRPECCCPCHPVKSARIAPRPQLPGECRVPTPAEQEEMAKEFPEFVQQTDAAPAKPDCPRCGESDRVRQEGDNDDGSPAWWCNRCLGWLTALEPLPGRHAPDFTGTPFIGGPPPAGLPPEPADRQQLPELDRALYTALRSCEGAGSFWDDVRQHGATDAELTAKVAEAFGCAAGVSAPNAEPFCWRGDPEPAFWFGTNLGRSICYSADGKPGTIPPTLAGLELVKAARRLLNIPRRKRGAHVEAKT